MKKKAEIVYFPEPPELDAEDLADLLGNIPPNESAGSFCSGPISLTGSSPELPGLFPN